MAGFRWTTRREEAALLVADDKLSNEEIAGRVGVTRQALDKWKRSAVFQARVAEHIAAFKEAIAAEGIANKQNRLDALNDRWRRMQRVIEARAAKNVDLTGGDTGLVVREVTYLPGGQTRERHEVDTGLLAELRATEKQAAQELRQWVEKHEHTGKDDGPVRFTIAIDRGRDKEE